MSDGVERRTLLAALAVVLVTAVGCAVWFAAEADELREGRSGSNLALVDPDATREVTMRVSAALKTVFSYDYANLERTERAVDIALTGTLARDYRTKFDAAARQARAQKLVRVSTVRSIGVRELRGGSASLLVFLDQQVLRPGGVPKSSTATLDVTAVRVDGSWRITGIETL